MRSKDYADNVRFWQFVNGDFVKITLRPGQELSWQAYQRTEEGWSTEYELWRHDHTRLYHEHGSDGTDCDGRLSSWHESEAGFDFVPCYGFDGLRPDWQPIDSGQHDYAAEAAGY